MAQSDDFGHVAVRCASEEPDLLAKNVAQISPGLHQLLNGIELCQDTYGRQGHSIGSKYFALHP